MITYVMTWLSIKADRRAVTALEYGLIAGVLVAGIAASVATLGTDLNTKFTAVGNSL